MIEREHIYIHRWSGELQRYAHTCIECGYIKPLEGEENPANDEQEQESGDGVGEQGSGEGEGEGTGSKKTTAKRGPK